MNTLTSAKVARAAGVNLGANRLYEKENFLPIPPRVSAGYQVFPDGAIHRVRLIRRTQTLGFALKEIKGFLALSVAGGVSCATGR